MNQFRHKRALAHSHATYDDQIARGVGLDELVHLLKELFPANKVRVALRESATDGDELLLRFHGYSIDRALDVIA